jgi:hypothetical protein
MFRPENGEDRRRGTDNPDLNWPVRHLIRLEHNDACFSRQLCCAARSGSSAFVRLGLFLESGKSSRFLDRKTGISSTA